MKNIYFKIFKNDNNKGRMIPSTLFKLRVPHLFLQQNLKKKQNNKSFCDFLDPEEFHFGNREIKIHNCVSILEPQSLKTSKSQLPLCTNFIGLHGGKKSFKHFFFAFYSSTN